MLSSIRFIGAFRSGKLTRQRSVSLRKRLFRRVGRRRADRSQGRAGRRWVVRFVRAVVLSEFGPPQNLAVAEVPDPVPGPGQVLVDVHFASITFVETQVRAGRAPNPAMLPSLPAILGNGVGGVVASVGAQADPALAGRQVITTTGGSGGYAERVAADAAGLIEVPAGLALADAVALLADGRTAVALVRAADLRAGQTVLVEAAAGGVGSLL